MPICARCTGILIGYLLGIFYLILMGPRHVFFEAALLIPLAVDGTLQLYTPYESTNLRRMITGMLFGMGIVVLSVSVMKHGFHFGRALAA